MPIARSKIADILRLVKVNLITYREAMRQDNVMLGLDAVRGINMLFPMEMQDNQLRTYGIIESTTIFREKTEQKQYYSCPNCRKNIEYDPRQDGTRPVTIQEMNQGGSDNYARRVQIWRRDNPMPVWTCPDCRCVQDKYDLDGSLIFHMRTVEQVDPNVLRVVPSPPHQQEYTGSIDGYGQWKAAMRSWLHNYYIELMAEVTRYRNDKIKSGEMAEMGIESEYDGDMQ